MSVKGSRSDDGHTMGALHKDLKVPTPDTFSGERTKLKAFLAQTELFIGFNSTRFVNETEKVLWAATLLRGPAFNWIEAFLADYLENRTSEGKCSTVMSKEAQTIFLTFKGFKDKITRVFGDIDQERTAERHIQNLRQKGSAASYTAEFQQYSGKTDWNDDALKAQYYKGLKDMVKDEIARSDRPGDLQAMINMAVKIDNRIFERNMEKRGQYASGDHKKRHHQKGHWPQPMELDATYRKPELSKDEKDRRYKNKLCFACGRPGHQSRNCKQPTRPKANCGRKQLNATLQGRGGYNKAMQLNATQRMDLSELESALGELSEGDESEEEYKEARAQRIEDYLDKNIDPSEPDYLPTILEEENEPARFRKAMRQVTQDHILETSTTESDWEEAIRDSDSQGSDDSFEIITDPDKFAIKDVMKQEEGMTLEREAEDLPMEDAADPNHPRHGLLWYGACYTDRCHYHYGAKMNNGRFPWKKKPVWWPAQPEQMHGYSIASECQFHGPRSMPTGKTGKCYTYQCWYLLQQQGQQTLN